ncbi:glyoxalase family protein [Klebsormidium nitens]|uniref:Glyoxalase family protein n=1 Tax=Klebsormidium nitens TaxID=105231 RepID=A0A0U9HI59_KLENI|nr:glyoxalase family protein [Klebsormidium nitens]|eukprot:GAQ78010.1 glyoxalase family protein [Klebsormidium nitens]
MASSPALAYIIVYVEDVEKSIAFYEKAFGLKTRMATGEKRTAWAEMETGSTTLAFTPKAQRETALSGGVKSHDDSEAAPNVLVSFTYDDVNSAYKHAIDSGAKPCAEPEPKPWGMTAGYVKDIDGILVQIGSRVKKQQ